jgi:hypothetical protein
MRQTLRGQLHSAAHGSAPDGHNLLAVVEIVLLLPSAPRLWPPLAVRFLARGGGCAPPRLARWRRLRLRLRLASCSLRDGGKQVVDDRCALLKATLLRRLRLGNTSLGNACFAAHREGARRSCSLTVARVQERRSFEVRPACGRAALGRDVAAVAARSCRSNRAGTTLHSCRASLRAPFARLSAQTASAARGQGGVASRQQ